MVLQEMEQVPVVGRQIILVSLRSYLTSNRVFFPIFSRAIRKHNFDQ